ncbi:MAG: molybdate transport repressor ModE-like protein [Afipia broomeae]|jgi:molybdate transport repressor ModE-like protein|uniref:ModE molybdate transport repressor domain-containing protein n=1 Tax=Afipia broomeae ATCC 49717 TaxID=883078 RepID=K8PQU1_9BRAD|nr:LysR family transcriptional regulator [Afipia broomeae]EKS41895.1 ModE molybdate transport repressor domain-containing protein [Afipia broomeae ATCC 49717]RTL79893.1 MAG: LysR family transcriptional regulator [Bradyrhizobiaceae bacterium]
MTDQFDWNLVRSFLAITRTGSMTAAAKRLKIDYSTLSRRIAALETSLGSQLFDRRTSGSSLTEAGERLLEMAEQMDQLATSAAQSIGDSKAQATGAVRIGTPDGFGTKFLAPRLGELSDRHPDLTIELVAMPREFNLSRREADIAVSLTQPTEGRLHGRKLTDYELGLYASHDYLVNHPAVETAADVPTHRFISYIDDLIFSPELEYAHFVSPDLRPAIKSSNLIAQLNSTLAGAGLCVLPCFIAQTEPELVRVLPNFRLIRTFWLLLHSDLRNIARVRVTADFIAEQASKAQALFMPNGQK